MGKSRRRLQHAVGLDPDVFSTSSRTGVAGQIASPEERAHFSYFLAQLYAKNGLSDRWLECLRRAIEEGYKGVNDVYSDPAFTELRKDPRLIQLMAARPPAISNEGRRVPTSRSTKKIPLQLNRTRGCPISRVL